jgi:hypothetical protein
VASAGVDSSGEGIAADVAGSGDRQFRGDAAERSAGADVIADAFGYGDTDGRRNVREPGAAVRGPKIRAVSQLVDSCGAAFMPLDYFPQTFFADVLQYASATCTGIALRSRFWPPASYRR